MRRLVQGDCEDDGQGRNGKALDERWNIHADYSKVKADKSPRPARSSVGGIPVRSTTVVGSVPQYPPSRISSKISKTDVAFKIHEPDYIAIQPIGENIVERMVDGEGMYMKMSYKSPIENESYECIVKMEYLNLR